MKNRTYSTFSSSSYKGEFYLEDEEIFSGLLINGGNQSYLDAKIWY